MKWRSRISLSHWRGAKKQTAVKGKYNCFNITPFHLCIICNVPFYHLVISLCEHGCVFSASFHHIRFNIALYQSISPYQHFTFSPLFHIFTAKRREKEALEQQATIRWKFYKKCWMCTLKHDIFLNIVILWTLKVVLGGHPTGPRIIWTIFIMSLSKSTLKYVLNI